MSLDCREVASSEAQLKVLPKFRSECRTSHISNFERLTNRNFNYLQYFVSYDVPVFGFSYINSCIMNAIFRRSNITTG